MSIDATAASERRYDTIEKFNMDSKLSVQLNLAQVARN